MWAASGRGMVIVAGRSTRSLECMSAVASTSRLEALTLGLGIVPWAIVPVIGSAAEALWPNHVLAYGVPLAVVSFASAIAAVLVGRSLGGLRSQLKGARWGCTLGAAFLAICSAVFVAGAVFAVWLHWWPK